jgi:hypothetical protein
LYACCYGCSVEVNKENGDDSFDFVLGVDDHLGVVRFLVRVSGTESTISGETWNRYIPGLCLVRNDRIESVSLGTLGKWVK